MFGRNRSHLSSAYYFSRLYEEAAKCSAKADSCADSNGRVLVQFRDYGPTGPEYRRGSQALGLLLQQCHSVQIAMASIDSLETLPMPVLFLQYTMTITMREYECSPNVIIYALTMGGTCALSRFMFMHLRIMRGSIEWMLFDVFKQQTMGLAATATALVR